MSETKWTPGPWFAHGPINANRQDYGVVSSRPYDPASTGGFQRRIAWIGNASSPHQSLTLEAEVAANAHLIAAAPELYTALDDLMGGDERMQVAIGGNPLYVDRFMDAARAALAKARGDETPP
jgi:hypothetical protein